MGSKNILISGDEYDLLQFLLTDELLKKISNSPLVHPRGTRRIVSLSDIDVEAITDRLEFVLCSDRFQENGEPNALGLRVDDLIGKFGLN